MVVLPRRTGGLASAIGLKNIAEHTRLASDGGGTGETVVGAKGAGGARGVVTTRAGRETV